MTLQKRSSVLSSRTPLDYLVALNAVDGLGPVRIKKLIQHFGAPEKVFRARPSYLVPCTFLSEKISANIINFPLEDFLKKEHALVQKHGVRVIFSSQKSYPARLKEISDPPIVLYCKGNIDLLNSFSIGVVGCRRASVYGMTTAEKLSQGLCDRGITVVSGLARGIDTAAHRGALRAKGKTIAVLGSGLAQVYPPENKKLFDEIARDGLVISEFSMNEFPKAKNFPCRNRIVSGLSLGVIVVEAAQKSGALITADLALEQGREVFAVPGKVDSANAQGVNSLIKQGAKLITCIDDVLDEFPSLVPAQTKKEKATPETKNALPPPALSEEERAVYQLLSSAPLDVDTLSHQSQLPASRLFSILLSLELKGLIKQMPGKRYCTKDKDVG